MRKLEFTITAEQRHKVTEKRVTVAANMATTDLHLNYDMIRLKRVYVDVQIKLDANGDFKGIFIAESKKVML